MLQPNSNKRIPTPDEVLGEKKIPTPQEILGEDLKKKDGTKAPSTSTTQPVSTESEQKSGSLDSTTEKFQKSLSTGIKPIPSQKPELKLSKEAKEFVQNIRPEDKKPIPEKRSFLGETFAKLRKGSAQLGADIAAAPELIYDVFATPQNYIAKKLNIPSLATDAEKFKETVGIENVVKDYYKKDVENIKRESELVDKKYQQGIYDSFASGNYEDGFRQLTNSFSESLPATASIMVGGAYTKAPQLLTASTIVFGAGKNEMLKEQNPEMDADKRVANALATGLAQGAFETLGSGSIGSAAKALVEREGRKKGMTILKDGLVNFYKESLKNNPMIASMSGEGIEEWATTVAENSIDVATGVKPQDFNVFEGSVDSFISGVFGGAVFGAGLKGLDKISNPQDRSTIKQNFKKTFELQNQLENPNISEPVKIEIEKSIKTISKETQDLISKNIDNVENLPEKVKEKLVDSTNKIDEIKKKAEEVKIDQNTSDASKQILLDSLKKEYEKELETRNGIIDGKVTEVDVLPLKEQDKIKREALKELTAELNPDGTKNITITDEQITERANKIYKKQQETELKDAETKIPTTETKIESETEVQEQPEVKEEVVYKQYKDLNQLESENKSTFPKIPTEKVFYSKPEVLPASEVSKADLFMEEGESEKLPSKEVDVRLIVPTQKNVTASNLKSVSKIKGDASEDIVLFEKEGKFYVLDGHHRIAKSILDGGKKIKARVFSEITQEPIAPKENDEVVLEPRIKDGLPRTIVFKDGEWQQKVGGQVSPISESVKKEAQIKFDETQTQRDITPDANVRPTISEVGEMAITEQPSTKVAETEVVESSIEPTASKGDSEVDKQGSDLENYSDIIGSARIKQESIPSKGDLVDFGDGLESVIDIVNIGGKQYIQSVIADGSSDRKNLYPIEEWSNTVSRQEEFALRRLENKKSQIEREKVAEEKQKKESERISEYNDIDGFANDKTSIQKGKILQHLNKKVYGTSIKEELRRISKLPYRFIDKDGKKRVVYTESDGTEFLLSDIYTTKIGVEFLQYLSEKQQPTRKETETKIDEQKQQKISDATKQLANKVREFKTSRPDIFSTASPASLAWDLGVETVAKSIELSGNVAQAVADGLKAIKETDWYKSLDKDKMSQVDSAFEQSFSQLQSEPKKESVQEKIEPKGTPTTSKSSRREKSSEEIASELGVSHDDYLDLKELVANEPKSGKFNEYLSGETIADVFGDKPTNDQQYEQLVLLNAIQHGNAVLDKAKQLFGQDYFTKTLQFLQDAKLPNFEKAVVYAAMENEIDTLVKSNPDNNLLKETQRLIYTDSQANLRNSSKGINAGRLRRIHNAIKKGYDVEKLVSGIVTPAQEEAKEVLRNAVPSGENLNKVSETEESAESEGKKYTQEEFEEALKKAIQEFKSKSRSDLSKKGKDIADKIRRLKLNKDVARADLSLGAYDLAIEAIAQLVEKGSTVAQAIKNVLSDPQFSQIDADKLREDILGVVRTPKIRDIVKQSLIDAGFSREITVTKNAKDEFGNDIVEDGKKVKVKEKKQVLDWVKLTGRMNTVEALRKNVEPQLRSQGYTDSQIEEISSELEAEYVRLTESIAERAMAELERRNQITPSPNRKSDLDRLVEYHSKGLFSQDAAKYERLINKIVGVSQRDQDVLDKIEAEIEKIKNLREVKIDGKYPDAKTIETQASHIAQAIRNIIAWANLRNSPIKNKAIVILSDLAGISRAAVLGNLYNAFQNIYSNWRAGFLAKAKFKTKGYYTKQLNEAFNELQNVITADVLANRGLDFGDTVSPFSHHSLFVEKAKDYITKNFSGSKQRALISLMNAFEGRLFLNIMDSRYKSKIVNIDFVMNLVDVLTSERQGKQKMTKEEAVEFVSNSLTGVNLEKAKELAKKFIADVNEMQEGTLLEDDATVNRLAFDIVRENLTSGNYFSMEEINEIYDASMKSGGLNIGHESNNIVSERIKFENNRIEKKIEDSLKEKDYDKAAKYGTYALVMKNILYPYMSGGMNWAFIEAEAGTPIGLITGAIKTRSNKPIDLLTDQGKKKLKETLKDKRDAESKLFRGLWGTSIGVSAYLAYQGLKALSVAGDDDEENKRLFNQYLKEHPEQRKIFDKFSPEIYAYSLAVSDERLSKYLLNKMGYKTDQNDNVLTLINSLQNKKSSSMGALGVLLGQVFSTPGSWRIIRDTQRLSRELKGEPMNQTQVKVTSFLNGYFKGAFIDYIGKRPGVNYDLERVRKEFENERTKFTKYTNSIADDIVEGNLTVEEAQKVLEKKYSDKPELLKKAIKIASDAINDQKIRDGLREADTWYMELYNEKNAYAKAYIYYQNVLKDKTPKEVERITQDKDFAKNINLATATMSKEMQSDFLDLVIQFKDVEEQKKSK